MKTLKKVKKNWLLYLFIVPAFAYLLVFKYAPLYGVQIAFRNYTFSKGITGSTWVGLKWFTTFFDSSKFLELLENTLRISIYELAVGFPLPILLALVLNNIKNQKFKKFAQTVTYMPHFISTVIIVGMMSVFFSPRSGFVNTLLSYLGFTGDIYFMGKASYFPHLYVWSGIWSGIGWGSILYMAALAGVDPALHEAAMIDGANKLQRVRHIDLPTIVPTMAIKLIMDCGKLMNVGHEKAFLMQNSLNVETSEIISTYVYKIGMGNQMYSYSAAVGLFENTVSFIMLIIVNKIVSKVSGSGLW